MPNKIDLTRLFTTDTYFATDIRWRSTSGDTVEVLLKLRQFTV